MHITLTYKGPVQGNARKQSDVWRLRKSFHKQLYKLSLTNEFEYVEKYANQDTEKSHPNIGIDVANSRYVPFITSKMKTRCSLYVRVFRGVRQYNPVLGNVDLDNRVKTLIDALRAPQQISETKESDGTVRYVLLEDDSLIDGITVKSGHYLDEEDEGVVLAIITANIHLAHATWANMHLGYPSAPF